MNIAINGFGRIGRSVFKALLERPGVTVVAVNDLTDTKTLAHLLKYDSCYGVYGRSVKATASALVVNGKSYPVYAEKDPQALPWAQLKVDIVIESTGRFTDKESASLHLKAGAKKVILSAPAKGDDVKTYVLGVNEDKLKKGDTVISMASCTTNCLSPVTDIILKKFGIENAIMTTIHCLKPPRARDANPYADRQHPGFVRQI